MLAYSVGVPQQRAVRWGSRTAPGAAAGPNRCRPGWPGHATAPPAPLARPLPARTQPPHCPAPQVDDSYVDEYISISQFPLSAAYALGRITNALERKWGIV